jgi:hypothetical protein
MALPSAHTAATLKHVAGKSTVQVSLLGVVYRACDHDKKQAVRLPIQQLPD